MTYTQSQLLASVLTAALLVTGCGNGSGGDTKDNTPNTQLNPGQPAGVEVSSKVTHSAFYKKDFLGKDLSPSKQVLQNQSEFDSKFMLFPSDASYAPKVDFSKRRMVFYTLGLQPNKATTLSLVRAYDDGKSVKVVFNKRTLGKGCAIESGETVPSLLVSVETARPIEIVTQEEVKTCVNSTVESYANRFATYDKTLKPYSKVLKNNIEYGEEFGKFNPEVSNLPQLDFGKKRVVVHSLGYQANNAKSLSLSGAYDEGDKVRVVINRHTLAAGCPVGSVENIPHIFVTVDTTKSVEVLVKDVSQPCTSKNVAFDVVKQSYGMNVYNKLQGMTANNKVLSTASAYHDEMAKFGYASADRPQVDFSRQQVVMSTLGARYHKGVSPSIQSVSETGGVASLHIRWDVLAEQCYNTVSNPDLTVPHVFFTVDSRKPIDITSDTKTNTDCGAIAN